MSAEARPMTRFVQYPFDKTKMEEVRAWIIDNKLADKMRATAGVKDLEVSFCPGEGWLGARYIYDDLDDMVNFLNSDALESGKAVIEAAPHYDASRAVHEFKGFFLPEA